MESGIYIKISLMKANGQLRYENREEECGEVQMLIGE